MCRCPRARSSASSVTPLLVAVADLAYLAVPAHEQPVWLQGRHAAMTHAAALHVATLKHDRAVIRDRCQRRRLVRAGGEDPRRDHDA